MKKTISLTGNTNFKKTYKRGKSIANRYLVLYYLKNKEQINRLGITVNKKVGKAVVRNRVRRLIKECYRLRENKIKNGYTIIIISRVRAANADFNKIENAIEDLLKKADLIKTKNF